MGHQIIVNRLESLGIEIPAAPQAVANYIPYVISGRLVYISGQICMRDGQLVSVGRCGDDVSVEEGYQAARCCGINVLAQLFNACESDWGRVRQCVKLGVFVNSVDTFYDQPRVANGVSDLMGDVFAECGRHARSAVSCNSLPLNSAVEVDAIFELAE